MPSSKVCDLQCPPKFIVPLKMHAAPQGYECYMSCAIKGDPTPHVTWLRNNVSLNTNTNYHITNTCGVCSLLILRVGPKDTGEYKIVAENAMGRAECSTKLTVRGQFLIPVMVTFAVYGRRSFQRIPKLKGHYLFFSSRINEDAEITVFPLRSLGKKKTYRE